MTAEGKRRNNNSGIQWALRRRASITPSLSSLTTTAAMDFGLNQMTIRERNDYWEGGGMEAAEKGGGGWFGNDAFTRRCWPGSEEHDTLSGAVAGTT